MGWLLSCRAGNSYPPSALPDDPTAAESASAALRPLVAVATYNEAENIEAMVAAIREAVPQADVLITDDASPDGTGAIADRLAAADVQVTVNHRAGKLGLGTAYLAAFEHVGRSGHDVLVTLDSDLSHDPERIPDLLAPIAAGEADLVIGSRYVEGGGIEGWPRSRHLMSGAVNRYTRLLFGTRVRDCSGGFRAYRADGLAEIDWSRQVAKGYAFLEEVLFRCEAAGLRVAEVPIVFRDRIKGESKISLAEATSAIRDLAWVCLRDRVGRAGTRRP